MSDKEFITQLQEIRKATLLQTKNIYNTEEACLFLGVKKQSLYELVRNQKIRYFKSAGGKLTYFRRSDLEKWMLAVEFSTKEESQHQVLLHSLS